MVKGLRFLAAGFWVLVSLEIGQAQTKDVAERSLAAVTVSPCDLLEHGSQFSGTVISVRGEIASGFEVFGLRLSCNGLDEIVWLDVASKNLEPKLTGVVEWALVPDLLAYVRAKDHSDLDWKSYPRPSEPVVLREDKACSKI